MRTRIRPAAVACLAAAAMTVGTGWLKAADDNNISLVTSAVVRQTGEPLKLKVEPKFKKSYKFEWQKKKERHRDPE